MKLKYDLSPQNAILTETLPTNTDHDPILPGGFISHQ